MMNKKTHQTKKRAQKGVALIIVTMFSMIMIIVVGAILKLAQTHYHSSVYQIKHTRAFYLAKAGMEWAIYRSQVAPGEFIKNNINRVGGELAPNRIEDPPASGYYPPIEVAIVDRGGGEYEISSTVETNTVQLK